MRLVAQLAVVSQLKGELGDDLFFLFDGARGLVNRLALLADRGDELLGEASESLLVHALQFMFGDHETHGDISECIRK